MTSPAIAPGDLEPLLAAVDGLRMAAVVAGLADVPLAGRRVGTPGGAAARVLLGRHLADLGATVRLDIFPVSAVPEVYAAPAVSWGDGTSGGHLRFGREVLPHLASADEPLLRRAGLAAAGQGDPAGCWLVVPDRMSLFEAYGHAHGALGLLIGRTVDEDGWHYTMLAGSAPGPLPILTVDGDTHALMRQLAEARSGWLAANAPIRRVDVRAANVLGRWRPAHQGRPDLLLTAHYDGVGDLPGLRQPSAADNGSGVAVVLEAARILAPALPDGVGFAVALLDAEEVGALGSARHAAQLRDDDAAPLVINIDGAGVLREAAAVEAGGPAHGLLAALDQAGRHTGLPLAAGPVASDNRRYAAAGLASVGIGAGMAGYHSPADTADRVEPTTLTAVARLVVATAWLTAHAPATLSSLIGDER
uniref:M28 family metallopeptidase n=1 Tax=Paractinoplanes polyasparticus TaxID=2856853 RepID=UPI001C8557E6|nr:M28 family peptidase [Actinoplanes polyasparticus]